MRAGLKLRAEPDWAGAAQTLIDGCANLAQPHDRLLLLDDVCSALGDELYPALLHLLYVIGARGTPEAQRAVAGTLVDGLMSGRLPSGRLAAWGAAASPDRASGTRSLGPIEYLCAWYAQTDGHGAGRTPLTADAFDRSLRALLGLVGHDPRAARLYADKLRADAADPLGGTLSRGTRHALRQLADAWDGPGHEQRAVDAFLDAQQGSGLDHLRWLQTAY